LQLHILISLTAIGFSLAARMVSAAPEATPLDLCLRTIAQAHSEAGKGLLMRALESDGRSMESRVRAVCAIEDQLRRYGPPTSVRWLDQWPGSLGGVFEIRYKNGQTVRGGLLLARSDVPLIRKLYVSRPLPSAETLEKLLRAGGVAPDTCRVNLCAIDLATDAKTATLVRGVNEDRRVYLASLHKLTVLRALSRKIRAGDAAWSEVVQVQRPLKSRGSGILKNWPDGAPVTIYTLATLMLAESDNAATDHLITRVSRGAIEDAVRLGCFSSEPDPRNFPYLLMTELVSLRYRGGDRRIEVLANYVGADQKKRMRILRDLRGTSMGKQPERIVSRPPVGADKIGWFASPREVCLTAVALARSSKWDPSQAEMAILRTGSNKIDLLPVAGDYVAAKAGLDWGHRSRFALVKSRSGKWHAVCLMLNGDERKVHSIDIDLLFEHIMYLAISGHLK